MRKSLFNNGFGHEEAVTVSWSIPKWTGYGPWVDDCLAKGFIADDGRGAYGFYRGCKDQRNRWRDGVEGSHLLEVGSFTVHLATSSQIADVRTDG